VGDEQPRHDDGTGAGMDLTRPLSNVDATQAVFVDTTGRRRHVVAWLAVVVCAVGLAFVGLLWFSQAGGSVDAPPAMVCPSAPPTPAGPSSAGCGTPSEGVPVWHNR
jgi:hypothetical protein